MIHGHLTRAQLTFRAGLSRLVIGGAALALIPQLFPRTRPHVWVLVVYLAVASIEQVLIARDFGGRTRALMAGLVDLCVVTLFIHLLGSTTSVFAAVYFFAGTLNALVVGLRVGLTLAALNAIAYDTVVWLEWGGVLPFAPDGAESMRAVRPTYEVALLATVLVTVLLMASSAVVGMLVHSVRRHEEDLTAANARLEDLSQRDPLTGLFNRRHLFEQLERELARSRRGHRVAVAMLDLDGFKRVNDTQGHLRGDLLLKEIASALGDTTRMVDVAARYGGDEFMVVLPDTDADQARVVAERMGAAVRDVGLKFDTQRPVTASMGVAVAHDDDSVASLIRRADESAYRAKRNGGDRVELSA
ncbi:MAG TPA: GGDEF domain-containing protein [Polyangiaceae bacterium]|jgi:diguanylate cyclase (GGDEF)-like protein